MKTAKTVERVHTHTHTQYILVNKKADILYALLNVNVYRTDQLRI